MRTWLIVAAALAMLCPAGAASAQEMCGGLAGYQCQNAGDYCRFEPAAQCGAADQTGTCEPKPEVCTEEYAPVCGCDDQTYSNACHAAQAGVSVVAAGECAAPAEPGSDDRKPKKPKG